MTRDEFADFCGRIKAAHEQLNKLSTILYDLAFEAAAMNLEEKGEKDGSDRDAFTASWSSRSDE